MLKTLQYVSTCLMLTRYVVKNEETGGCINYIMKSPHNLYTLPDIRVIKSRRIAKYIISVRKSLVKGSSGRQQDDIKKDLK
jgi:hypothetical protein